MQALRKHISQLHPKALVRRARLHVGKGPLLYFLGDSHLGTVRHAYAKGWFDPWRCKFLSVGGATAVGLRHPTSKTQALEKFKSVLLPHQPGVIPILQLGEVDCGFVIWHRAKKYKESIEQQLEASIEAYVTFIADLKQAGFGKVIVTSAVLPTIGDGDFKGEVALLRKDIGATLRQRTDLTLEYNQRLEHRVIEVGGTYLDLTPDLLDLSRNLIRADFKNSDENDHHLDPKSGGHLWARRVDGMLRHDGFLP